MKLRLTFGIFPKLLLTMLVVTLIPLGAIWYLDYRAESESLSRQIEQRLSSQADTLAGYVDAWVDMNVRMLRQNAALDDMSSMDPKKQKPLLRAIIAEYKWAYLTFTIAPDGNNIGRNDEEALRFYGDRGYFKQAIEGPASAPRAPRPAAQPADNPQLARARAVIESELTEFVGPIAPLLCREHMARTAAAGPPWDWRELVEAVAREIGDRAKEDRFKQQTLARLLTR